MGKREPIEDISAVLGNGACDFTPWSNEDLDIIAIHDTVGEKKIGYSSIFGYKKSFSTMPLILHLILREISRAQKSGSGKWQACVR